jgi:hypothetical protein
MVHNDLIRNDPAKRSQDAQTSTLYITLCQAHNCYGGPEEGGWYYTGLEPIASESLEVPVLNSTDVAYDYMDRHRAECEAIKNRLLRDHPEASQPYEGSGVGGCGDDDDLMIGESLSEGDEFQFAYTEGEPYTWPGRPHYE